MRERRRREYQNVFTTIHIRTPLPSSILPRAGRAHAEDKGYSHILVATRLRIRLLVPGNREV